MQAFARSIVDTVRHPLLVLDAEMRVVVANPSYYRIFGGSESSTERQSLFEIDAGRWEQPRLRSLLKEVIPRNGAFNDLEFECDCPRLGRRLMVLNAHRVVREDDGKAMVLLAIEDETEIRRVRDELRVSHADLERRDVDRTAELELANQELRAANQELEAFCFSVSHDLRSPLRALDGFSRELLESHAGQLDEQGRHYLRRVRIGTQRMGNLIDDLLKLSRITRVEMRRVRVDLTALAETTFAELRELEPGRTVTFTALPGLSADCDAALLRVVFENLLGNALKFTSKKPTATITFDQTEVDGKSAFVVRDDGAGFDMAYMGKLFGAFQRLHSDRDFTGTGVGLATVQRIVRRHGGKVWAEGVVGVGAALFFTIPGPEERS